MYKFLESGRSIDPLDVLKEIYDCHFDYLNETSIHKVKQLEMVIDKIEIQRINNGE